jgi:undecaprenyl phosphate-alpha-L-ara4N flippase subunit ArnE
MASSAATIAQQTSRRTNKSVYMVLGCTVFAAAAQVLLKFGAQHAMPAINPSDVSTWIPFLTALLGNYPLLLGYTAHSGNALLLILALKDGELSLLYPIIALTYVWVNLLSMYFFHDHMNPWKAIGIALVIGGVAVMGRASSRS